MTTQRSPLVTVMVACYNHERYITESIESILNQTYPDIELIVIDDGSRDASPAILAALAKKHGFYFEQQPNMGLSKTLNKMLGLARGDYIVSFGSDDVMLPDRIRKQVQFMEAHPDIDVSGGNIISIDQEGVAYDRQRQAPARELVFDDFFLNLKPGIQAATAMVRAKVFRAEGGYDPDIPLEDIYMWLKLSSRGYRFYAMDDVLAHYRKHGANTYKNIRHMLDALLKTIAPYRAHPAYAQAKNRILVSHFLAASRQDSDLAWHIFRQIDRGFYSTKVLRGLLRICFKNPWAWSPLLLLAIAAQSWIPVLLFLLAAALTQENRTQEKNKT